MRISTRVAAVGAAAAIAATSVVAMLPAGAAPTPATTTLPGVTTTTSGPTTTAAGPQQVNSNVTGTITLHNPSSATQLPPLPAPTGSKFTGTFDGSTGAIQGNFSWGIGGQVTGLDLSNILAGAMGNLNFKLSPTGPASGNVNLATKVVTLTDTESFTLQSIDLTAPVKLNVPFAAGCVVTPITLQYTGTYDPTTGGVDITSAAASLPAIPAGGCGTFSAIDLTTSINTLLSGATATAHLNFVLGVQTIVPPASTTTTVAPKAPTTAPAATPTSGTPKFTG